MMQRVARFRKLKGSDGGLPDSDVPECRRTLYNVIGFQPPQNRASEATTSPVGDDASNMAAIAIAEGFNLGYCRAKPGKGPLMHNHDTNETFIAMTGRWRCEWNEGEAQEHIGPLADLGEGRGARVAGDVLRDGELAVGARALGMHAALGDHLAIEMRQLLDQPDVLQQGRAARAGGLDVEVVDHRRAGGMGQLAGRRDRRAHRRLLAGEELHDARKPRPAQGRVGGDQIERRRRPAGQRRTRHVQVVTRVW